MASRIDEVARREMEQLHPWMLPFTPRELRYWESRQIARTETNDEQVSDIPSACSDADLLYRLTKDQYGYLI